jgi:hypothetical protein
MKVCKMFLMIAAWIVLAMLATSASAYQWQTVYQTDFSSDPGWTTDDSAKLGIDTASGTFHGIQVNTEGTYAYIPVSGFDPNKTWSLSYDLAINSCGWSAGATFGLFDNTLKYPNGAISDQSIGDMGHGTSLESKSTSVWTFSPNWSTGVWYHGEMLYDAATAQLSLIVSDRSTGTPIWNLSSQVTPFTSDVINLGVSRLHIKNTGGGASPSATVNYNLDNVVLSQAVPEPSTLILLGMGAISLIFVWRRRNRAN